MAVDSTANIMKVVKVLIMTVIILSKFYIALSEIVIPPSDTEAVVGHQTYLNCSTSDPSKGISWYYFIPGKPEDSIDIYLSGNIVPVYKDRVRVESYTSDKDTRAFNLIIDSVNARDAGKYVCHEESESDQYSDAELIVLDALPVCKVRDYEDGFIGSNNCDLKKEDILLSCETKYYGNISPVFEWKNDGMELIKDGVTQLNDKSNTTSLLSLSNDSVQIQSSYSCQTTRSAFEQHNCTIAPEAIKIIYGFENFSISQMWVGDVATCTANSSQPCSYKWVLDHGGHCSVVSDNSKVTLNSPGLYRCEAECAFRKKSCRVISAQIQAHNKANVEEHRGPAESPGTTTVSCMSSDANANNHWKISVIVILLVVVLMVILGSVLVVRLRRQRSQLNRMNEREELRDPEIRFDRETDSLMPQVQLASDTCTCSSADLRERRYELKTEGAEHRQDDGQKASDELLDEETPSNNENPKATVMRTISLD